MKTLQFLDIHPFLSNRVTQLMEYLCNVTQITLFSFWGNSATVFQPQTPQEVKLVKVELGYFLLTDLVFILVYHPLLLTG